MKARVFLIGLGMAWAATGCAQRDNPFDPANLARTESVAPVPDSNTLVVDPDSTCRSCPYYGTIRSAISDASSGDTVWIKGGTYVMDGLIGVSRGGTYGRPTVIRSYDGEARMLAGAGMEACLRVDQPYIELKGLACVGAEGAGLILNAIQGPVRVDSSRFDSCGTWGIRINDVALASLQDVQLTRNGTTPALEVVDVDSLDTLRVVETLR